MLRCEKRIKLVRPLESSTSHSVYALFFGDKSKIIQLRDRRITWHFKKHPRFLQKTRCTQDDSDFATRILYKTPVTKMAAIATIIKFGCVLNCPQSTNRRQATFKLNFASIPFCKHNRERVRLHVIITRYPRNPQEKVNRK